MVSAIIINTNSYATRAQANTYLGDSPRTTSWEFLDNDTKDRSLIAAVREIEKQRYLGARTGVENVATIVVNAGGSGYVVGDILTVAGGTGGAATAQVATVSSGAVVTLTLLDSGLYSVQPGTTAVATTGGTGTSCTVDLTFTEQALSFPRTGLTDLDGSAVDSDTVPEAVRSAQIELAYLISVDSTIEGSSGTSDNNKRLKAGSVEIERFRPVEGPRFPNIVFELLRSFLSGLGLGAGATAFGTDGETTFEDDYGLNQGFA